MPPPSIWPTVTGKGPRADPTQRGAWPGIYQPECDIPFRGKSPGEEDLSSRQCQRQLCAQNPGAVDNASPEEAGKEGRAALWLIVPGGGRAHSTPWGNRGQPSGEQLPLLVFKAVALCSGHRGMETACLLDSRGLLCLATKWHGHPTTHSEPGWWGDTHQRDSGIKRGYMG